MSFMVIGSMLSAFSGMVSASNAAAAQRRLAERQDFQAKIEEVKGMQMHNERRSAYFAFESEMDGALAINNRALSDRSAGAIKKKAKQANRDELNRIRAQTLFSAGKYRAEANESRSAASSIMMAGMFNTASSMAMNFHKMQQVTPPDTTMYIPPSGMFGGD
jgi:hypothetical protein